MTRAGDAAPDRSQSEWIIRLHRDTGTSGATTTDGDTGAVLAGPVVARRGRVANGFDAVSVHRRPAGGPLELARHILDLRCESRDLPSERSAPPATDLDHVVHILCSSFTDPEAIEGFMDATRGLIDDFFDGRPGFIGREAWFEVLAHPTDTTGGTGDYPLVDDVYVARYPTADAWLELHDWAPWRNAVEAIEAEATTMFHLVIRPTINRLAAHR